MKIKNKVVNWKINFHTETNLLDTVAVEYLVETATQFIKSNVDKYTYGITATALENCYIVSINIEFKDLNNSNLFKEANYITSKFSKLLPGNSYIEEVFTNWL